MNELIKRVDELEDKIHENLHDYPLFKEILDDIYDKRFPEIEKLLIKNEEFYIREAIKKLNKLNDYIVNTSKEIDKQYKLFDKQAIEWNKYIYIDADQSIIDDMNDKSKKANKLINSHKLEDLIEANKIMKDLIYKAKYYNDK